MGAAVAAIHKVLQGPRALTEDEAALTAWREHEANASATIGRTINHRQLAIQAASSRANA